MPRDPGSNVPLWKTSAAMSWSVTFTDSHRIFILDPHRVLWPIIGILAEAIVIAAIILFSEYYKKTRNEKGNKKNQLKLKLII